MKKWMVGLLLMAGMSVANAGKQIVILEVNTNVPNMLNVHYLMWLPVTKPIPKPSFSSAWTGASGAETAALQAGTIVEENYNEQFGASEATSVIKAHLLAKWNDRNAYFQSQAAPGQFFGVYYDGSTLWSQ